MSKKRLGTTVFWTLLVTIILVAAPGAIIAPFIAVSPFIVTIATITFYYVYLLPSYGSYLPFTLFIAGLIAAGGLAGSYGAQKGIRFFCNGGGNLCGLGGTFVTGPLAFSLAEIAYTFLWFACVIAFKALKLPR